MATNKIQTNPMADHWLIPIHRFAVNLRIYSGFEAVKTAIFQ
jgi:hypothetical protein